MTVVNVSATSFPQTLDWLHSYLLEVLQLLLSHSEPSQVNKIFFNNTNCVTWIVLLSIEFINLNRWNPNPSMSFTSFCQSAYINRSAELDCVHFLVCSALSRDVVHHQAPRLVLNCSVLYTKMHKFSYHGHHGRLYVKGYEQQLHKPFGQFSLYTAQTRKSFNRCRILVSPNMLLLFSYIIWNQAGRIESSPFSHSPFLCCKDLGFGVKNALKHLE